MRNRYEYVIKPGFFCRPYEKKVIIQNQFEASINGNYESQASFVSAFNRVRPMPMCLKLSVGLDENDVDARENVKQLLACVIRNTSIKELELNLELRSQFSKGLDAADIIEVFQNNSLDLNRFSIHLNRGGWCPNNCFDPIFASLRGRIHTLDCSFNAGSNLRGIRSLNFAQISLHCLELGVPRQDYCGTDHSQGSRTLTKATLNNFIRAIPLLKLKHLSGYEWRLHELNPDFLFGNFKELASHFTALDLTGLFTANDNSNYFHDAFHDSLLEKVPSSIAQINLRQNKLNELRCLANSLPHVKTIEVSISEIEAMNVEQLEQFARMAPAANIIAYDQAGCVTSSRKTNWLQNKMAGTLQEPTASVSLTV